MPRERGPEGACHPLSRALLCGLLVLFSLLALPAFALHQRIYPLAELIEDSDCIAVGRAVAVDIPRMRAALHLEETLKGEAPYRWLALNVAPGGWGHPTAMIRRLGPGQPLLCFAARIKNRHVLLGYSNGTWFQITAPHAPEEMDADRLSWSFTHIEVYLRRTFHGSTAELEQIVREVLAGRRKAPAPDPAVRPGMGPETPLDFQSDRPLPPVPDFIAKAIAAPRSGGVVRKVATRPLTPGERRWVEEQAKAYQRTPEDTALLLAQAKYDMRDGERALQYEKEYGRGGNRAWMRSAEEILDLKQRSDRFCWLDIKGTLLRAGELFTPVGDPVDLIHGLRTRFTWDELDPILDDDKWDRKKLEEALAPIQDARRQHPLGPGDRARAVLANLAFGGRCTGQLPIESCGWKQLPGPNWDFARRQYDWDGGEGGTQRPGTVRFQAPGSARNPIANLPPKPGLPFAAKAGDYPGASLWFATSPGDYERRRRSGRGCYAYADDTWVRVRQGDSRSFLLVAQVYTPDHTDEVGEPRAGWFYIRRPSRYIDAGIRLVDGETRSVSLIPEQALLLKVEPVLERFDRVLLRVDITTQKLEGRRNTEGRNEVTLTAFADGVGEVARTTVNLNKARMGREAVLDAGDAGVAFTPAFGLRTPGEGYVPEFYLGHVRLQQINEGEVELIPPNAPAG